MKIQITIQITNVPLDWVIKSIDNRGNQIKNDFKFTKDEFLRGITFLMESTFFHFNKVYYKQTFRTPMGTTLFEMCIWHFYNYQKGRFNIVIKL